LQRDDAVSSARCLESRTAWSTDARPVAGPSE
jgi:hypothetical protein